MAVLAHLRCSMYLAIELCGLRMQELEEEEAALWAQQLTIAREEGERARVRCASCATVAFAIGCPCCRLAEHML